MRKITGRISASELYNMSDGYDDNGCDDSYGVNNAYNISNVSTAMGYNDDGDMWDIDFDDIVKEIDSEMTEPEIENFIKDLENLNNKR